MKPEPPPPGWIERVYRWGVGLAIPVTILVGVVLLLTARDPHGLSAPELAGATTAPAAAPVVLMAEPLQDKTPSVLLRKATQPRCPPTADGVRPDPCAAPVGR